MHVITDRNLTCFIVPTIDLTGSLLARLSDLLAAKPHAEPGLFGRSIKPICSASKRSILPSVITMSAISQIWTRRRMLVGVFRTPITVGADLEYVCQEVAYADQTFERRRDWPLMDVTAKSVEEIATEVISLPGRPSQDKDDIDLE